MKKRLFAIMLALAMLLAAVPALAEEGDGGKDQTVESIKKVCTKCNVEVDKVNEEGLCEKCVSNLKQDNTQQKMITSFKTLNEDNTGGGANGDSTGSSGDNTDDNTVNTDNTGGNTGESSNIGNNGENTGNNAGNTGNNGGNTGSTGNTGTTGGQNPSTSDGEGGSGQPANPPQLTCNHTNVKYEQYATEAEGRYTHHKKVCKDCGRELVKEPHQWDETTKKPKTEGTDKIPTCTNGGHWTMQCGLCGHVTVFDGPALGHNYEYLWGTWDCKTKTITAYRKCNRVGCNVVENASAISVSEKDRDTWYSCGKKYTTVYYKVVAKYSDSKAVEYTGKAECTYSTSDYCRPDWYYDPCYYNNPCGHWGCGNVCTRYSDCVPCRDYRTTFRVGGYNCLATPKTGDVSVIGMALISLAGAGAAIMGKKRK